MQISKQNKAHTSLCKECCSSQLVLPALNIKSKVSAMNAKVLQQQKKTLFSLPSGEEIKVSRFDNIPRETLWTRCC